MATPTHVGEHQRRSIEFLDSRRFPSVGADGLRMLSPMDTCPARTLVGGVMGGVFGAAIAVLLQVSSGMGGAPAGGLMNPMPGMPSPQQLAADNAKAAAKPPTTSAAHAAKQTPAPQPLPPAAAAPSLASSAAASSPAPARPTMSIGGAQVPVISVRPPLLSAPVVGPVMPSLRSLPVAPVSDPIYGQASLAASNEITWAGTKAYWRDVGRQSKGNFKTWGIMSATFTGTECAIETVRGKSDELNPVAAGCATGMILAARAGPSGMAMGCAGFASFSWAMEKIMHNYL